MNRKGRIKTVGWALLPVFLYTGASNLLYLLLDLCLYRIKPSGLFLQFLVVLLCLLPITYFWRRQDLPAASVGEASDRSMWRTIAPYAGYGMLSFVTSVALNNLIFLSGLAEKSENYKRTAEIFYGNDLALEIVTLAVLGPMLEEILYRGFVYHRLQRLGQGTAIVGSALIFGLFHFNIVQGVYAAGMGLLLAYTVCRTKRLSVAIWCHGLTNLVSVLLTEL